MNEGHFIHTAYCLYDYVCVCILEILRIYFGAQTGVSVLIYDEAFQNTEWHLTFTDSHIFKYPLIAAIQSNKVRQLILEKIYRISTSNGVRFTKIRCVVYLLWIFKIFQNLWITIYEQWYEKIENDPQLAILYVLNAKMSAKSLQPIKYLEFTSQRKASFYLSKC
jgi:general stress protein 26